MPMKERNWPELCVRFYLSSDEADLDEITEVMGLVPERVRKKHEWPIGTINAGLARDSWQLSSERGYSTSVGESLAQMINLLKGKEKTIRYLVEKYDMRVTFDVVIYAEVGALPDLSIKKEVFQFLAGLNARIGYDPYIFDEVDE
jgi:hypothetical protein